MYRSSFEVASWSTNFTLTVVAEAAGCLCAYAHGEAEKEQGIAQTSEAAAPKHLLRLVLAKVRTLRSPAALLLSGICAMSSELNCGSTFAPACSPVGAGRAAAPANDAFGLPVLYRQPRVHTIGYSHIDTSTAGDAQEVQCHRPTGQSCDWRALPAYSEWQ